MNEKKEQIYYTRQTVKFLVDEMHGKLSHWMRLLGYQVKYSRDYEEKYGKPVKDKYLIEECLNEKRILITADKEMNRIINEKSKKLNFEIYYENTLVSIGIYVHCQKLNKQIEELQQSIPIDTELDWNNCYCTMCGGENKEIKKEDYKELIPPMVYNSCDYYWKCSTCHKIYWLGGQTKNIINKYQNEIAHLKKNDE